MTDIFLIETLRAYSENEFNAPAERKAMREAADEIERLRLEFYHYEKENTYKGNSIRHWYNKAMAYGKGLDEANSEIERLQAVADAARRLCPEVNGKPAYLTNDYHWPAEEALRAALAALEVDDD